MSRIFKLGRYFYDLDNVWRCSYSKLSDHSILVINEETVKIFDKGLDKKAKELLDTFVGKAKANDGKSK